MTLLLVDLKDEAVDIKPIPKVGRNAVVSCEVRYDGLRVPVSRRVGDEGEGFRYLLDGLNPERILIAAEALGIGKVALRRAVSYAKERVVFGRPIGKNQGLTFPLADSHAQLRAAEQMIRLASWRYDNGLNCSEEANRTKYWAAPTRYEHSATPANQTGNSSTPSLPANFRRATYHICDVNYKRDNHEQMCGRALLRVS